MAASIAIALGSNLGDRCAHLDFAVSRLRGLTDDLIVSTYHQTDPVDVVGSQALFLNAAAVGTYRGTARQLLQTLLAIEAECGRQRPHRGAARTLDLDLILFGRSVIDEPGLQVPHPRFRARPFVLAPLAEVGPDLIDPVTGQTVAQLLAAMVRGPR
ncbi:MAG TPA: 2-amino-4-hydroxy-6-hydroxymethyldihydropteridine diphosphokinase [Vicinamibacterales bacterium]|jgi:2-amino-4-hydroxy-6-hydroxymethyldihydropteridine diphosphokinase